MRYNRAVAGGATSMNQVANDKALRSGPRSPQGLVALTLRRRSGRGRRRALVPVADRRRSTAFAEVAEAVSFLGGQPVLAWRRARSRSVHRSGAAWRQAQRRNFLVILQTIDATLGIRDLLSKPDGLRGFAPAGRLTAGGEAIGDRFAGRWTSRAKSRRRIARALLVRKRRTVEARVETNCGLLERVPRS
jgi:hypothetical protein